MSNGVNAQGSPKKEDYVDKAERLMKKLNTYISTSKIRDLLAQVNELYNDIILEQDEKLDTQYVEKIRHLKVKMIYDAGRDSQLISVGKGKKISKLTYFFQETGLLVMVDEIGDSRKKFLEYCRYFEALVAYHKFYGGK